MATVGSESVRSGMSVASDEDADALASPITPQTLAPPPVPELKVLSPGSGAFEVEEGPSGLASHDHEYHTPMSIDTRYQSVVYGEFLMKKVANNFVDGKREKY